jgi:flagellar basal-body rod protein FlgB
LTNNIFSSLDMYKKGLQAMTLRSEVIANNIANAETPGYKAKDVSFESVFRDHIRRKYSFSDHNMESIRFRVDRRSDRRTVSTGNNVDMEQEMIKAAENNMAHELLVKALNSRIYMLKNAIKEGRR